MLTAVVLLPSTAGLGLSGCAARRVDGPRPGVTVIVHGDEPARLAARRGLATTDLEVEVRLAEPPNAPPVATVRPDLEPAIASARGHYIAGEFDQCAAAVASDELVEAALVERDRVLAARTLLWRVACHTGAGDLERARASANTFAVLDLEVPVDIEAVTPEVEAILGEALTVSRATKRVPLRIASNTTRAQVAIDGRAPSCTTPCTIDLPIGDHALALSADGWQTTRRRVRVAANDSAVDVVLAAASPELAATQWTVRFGDGVDVDSANSVRLLSRAARARRLVLLSADGDGSTRVRGVLAIDERITARAERSGPAKATGESAAAVLHDLMIAGKLVEKAKPIYKRPVFWIAIVLSAAGAATLTGLLVRQPPSRTRVTIQ